MPQRQKNNRTAIRAVRTVRNGLKFHKLKIDTHPPDFVSNPWFPLILRIQNVPATVTCVTLDNAIASQLGIVPGTAGAFEYRLEYVKLWGALVPPSGSSFLNPVTLACFDPISAAGNTDSLLQVLTDYPDQVRRAAIGFKYSYPQQQAVIRGGFARTLFRSQGVGAGSVMYVRLFWRSQNVEIQSALGSFEPSGSERHFEQPTAPAHSPDLSYAHCRGLIQQI